MTIIFNPVSGRSDPEVRRQLIQKALAEHGYRCQYLVTTPEEGARHLAEQALREGVDLLAVSGGDGTVVETMTALIGSDIPLAIFPAGTGNLLSVNLNLPRDVTQAVHAALFGNRRTLDLARVTTPADTARGEPGRCFAIVAGAGYDAWLIRGADREAKNRLGVGAYLLSALRNLRRRPIRVELRLDGAPRTLRRRAKSVMVANMGLLQGGVEMIPGAHPDDGILNVAILKAETLRDWVVLALHALLHRKHARTLIEYHEARHVEVVLSKAQPMEFDGEDSKEAHHSFTVEVLPKAVVVMVPKSAPV